MILDGGIITSILYESSSPQSRRSRKAEKNLGRCVDAKVSSADCSFTVNHSAVLSRDQKSYQHYSTRAAFLVQNHL